MNKRMIALVGAAVVSLGLGACNSPADSNGVKGDNQNGLSPDRTAQPGARPGRTGDAGDVDDAKANKPVAPDNTAVNKRDQSGDAVTPMDQGENAADLATTSSIRRDILKTDGLSTAADNVKVITADGQVTLRGVVKTQAEKDQIQKIAEQIAGPGKVQNQLEIDTNNKM